MFVVVCLYNLCENHHTLRLKLSVGRRGYRWVQRTPAMAAGLTNHRWSVEEVLNFKVPLPRWKPPKRRGRPSKALLARIAAWGLASTVKCRCTAPGVRGMIRQVRFSSRGMLCMAGLFSWHETPWQDEYFPCPLESYYAR